ncbi:SAM-dependent methyltransferase [Bacillus sp. SA1-12]|uniref:tRNA (adenine(22)-N(1))-methyltransferase n=1 Tax=Bacillus sp. SA1-12 TaxID=1455638 RepID=UPI0006270B42|nr:tRNA (adenine(22)-N(1))-methyltransferase TrmK [Bacillus sp. SA1-12]KKI88583.1 SAM-dependent methyltransferase [Bacillus sp. SA1-12]
MNELKLSKRLETVADYIPKGAVFADIGSDHAYLPCYSILKGIAKAAIAGEITDGPFLSAKSQVLKTELTDKISVRLGDGLSVIEEGEAVDCITIAGMGGSLIKKILEDGSSRLNHVKRLVLQPNIHAISIRNWLIDNGWTLIDEEILEEDHKIYEILVAEKGDPLLPYQSISQEANLLLGPILARKKSPVFIKKWSQEYNHWKTIVQKLEQAGHTFENNEKYRELTNKMKLVEEVLQS